MKRGETTFHYNNNQFSLPLLVSFSFFPKKADGSVRVSVEEKSTVFYSQERESSFTTQVSFSIYIPSQGSQAQPSAGQVEVQRKTPQRSDCAIYPEPTPYNQTHTEYADFLCPLTGMKSAYFCGITEMW